MQNERGLRGKYIDPRYQTAIRFGTTSPYLLPWRAYGETLPISALRNALGVNLNLGDAAPEPVLKHLAACGVRHGRIEVGWGNAFSDVTETALREDTQKSLRPLLLACRANGVRPLILLNANHGVPVPLTNTQKTLARPARKGDRVAYLADVAGLLPNRSGFNNVSLYKAAEVMFTGIESDGKVTLSRPLPKDLGERGKAVEVGTLRYLPFGFPDAQENAATLGAWKRYALTVARFVAQTLTQTGASDRGFDIEIWNELSFGSHFLAAERYFDPVPFRPKPDIDSEIVAATVEVATANAATFAGVLLCNGFANTIPWTASAKQPARIHALSKHPYSSVALYDGKPPQDFPVINARFVAEAKPAFYPRYRGAFPEYFANSLQTEHVVRDLSPITTDLYDTKHGRFARGGTEPFCVWFTEWGIVPKDWGVPDPVAAQNLKAKAHLRMLCFHVGKGLERLYLYAARGEDAGLGLVSERFITHAATVREFPPNDAGYRSPVLATLKRLMDALGGGTDVRQPRSITVNDIRDAHDHYQWRGDETDAHPTLYNRECFAFLPFQKSATEYVFICYIQTRDITKSLPSERYSLVLSGFAHPLNVRVTRLYDPVTGVNIGGARINYADGSGAVTVSLPVTDYPYLLFVSDAA